MPKKNKKLDELFKESDRERKAGTLKDWPPTKTPKAILKKPRKFAVDNIGVQ